MSSKKEPNADEESLLKSCINGGRVCRFIFSQPGWSCALINVIFFAVTQFFQEPNTAIYVTRREELAGIHPRSALVCQRSLVPSPCGPGGLHTSNPPTPIPTHWSQGAWKAFPISLQQEKLLRFKVWEVGQEKKKRRLSKGANSLRSFTTRHLFTH